MSTSRFVNKFRNVATITEQRSDGTAVARLKTGQYTYSGCYIGVRSKVEIVGKTVAVDGKHYVKSANLPEFVGEIRLEIDNVVERNLSCARHIAFNQKDGYDVQDGIIYMPFGGPFQFDNMAVEDVYQLGTKDVRDLEITFDLTAAWDNSNMFLEIMSEYTSSVRPIGFLRTTKTLIRNATGAGEFTIDGLPIHSDIAAIYVLGSNIKSAVLTVDDVEVESAGNYWIAARNKLFGVNTDALGDGVVFDFLRDKDVNKGLKSLESNAQRKRNADLLITLDMMDAEELTVIVDQIGRYAQQG